MRYPRVSLVGTPSGCTTSPGKKWDSHGTKWDRMGKGSGLRYVAQRHSWEFLRIGHLRESGSQLFKNIFSDALTVEDLLNRFVGRPEFPTYVVFVPGSLVQTIF